MIAAKSSEMNLSISLKYQSYGSGLFELLF